MVLIENYAFFWGRLPLEDALIRAKKIIKILKEWLMDPLTWVGVRRQEFQISK